MIVVHGSTVAVNRRGLLIRGPSGSGKSALALALMALGAGLVADDQTRLRRVGADILADAPKALRGRIEARHVGILRAEAAGEVPLALIVTLGEAAAPRLPDPAEEEVLGLPVPTLAARAHPALAPALRQWLIGGPAA